VVPGRRLGCMLRTSGPTCARLGLGS
jgi:hypothetical protein